MLGFDFTFADATCWADVAAASLFDSADLVFAVLGVLVLHDTASSAVVLATLLLIEDYGACQR